MNARGQYGSSRRGSPRVGSPRRGSPGVGSPLVGQVPPRTATVYVEREPSSAVRILSAIAVVGSVLWTRHQSRQIEQLYKKVGLPHQSFTASLRQGAGDSLRGLAERVRPKRQGKS